MASKALVLCAVTLLCTAALAQPEPSRPATDGERAPRPESASNARVGGWCDALTGKKKEQCLRDESRKPPERSGKADRLGTCDDLIGPDRERCLRQGGTIEVDVKADPRGSTGGAAQSQ